MPYCYTIHFKGGCNKYNIDKQTLFTLMALETFKARLKAKSKAAGANLSQKRIDAQADRLNKKFPDLTEETDHDAKIDDIFDEQDFKDLSAADDFQRAKDAKDKKDKADKAKTKDVDDTDDEPEPDKMPAWAKALVETVTSLKAEKEQQSMQQKLSANEKLKGIDQKLYSKWQLPKTDEEIEAFADEVVSTYGHLLPKEGGETVTGSFIPGQTRQSASAKAGKVDADIVNFAKSKNEQAKATVKV